MHSSDDESIAPRLRKCKIKARKSLTAGPGVVCRVDFLPGA
jgi:hypothetical protein